MMKGMARIRFTNAAAGAEMRLPVRQPRHREERAEEDAAGERDGEELERR